MNNTPRMSVLLMALLSQLSFAPYAQAEPSNEWGVWASGDEPPPPQNWSSNQQYQPNPDQTRTSVNDGNLLEAIASGDWIGYVLYDTTQTVVTSVSVSGSGSFTSTTTNILAQNQLAMLTLNPQRNAPTEEVTVQAFVRDPFNTGTLDISSDLDVFNMSFDSANNITNVPGGSFFEFGFTDAQFFGYYQTQGTTKRAYSGMSMWTQTYYGEINLSDGNKGSTSPYTNGNGYFGKIMSAGDIAYLAQQYPGPGYTLSGQSYLGSDVNIYIDFGDKSWNGTWSQNNGGSFRHNGFDASGTISGSTLTSNQLSGFRDSEGSRIGDVLGGNVQGTLVGIAKPVDYNLPINEDVGVVGKTTLTVVAGESSTKVVNDVFIAVGNNVRVGGVEAAPAQ